MTAIAAVILDAFRDAMDRKIFWIMLWISALIAASMACVGFTETGVDVLFGTWSFDTQEWSLSSEELRANVAGLMVQQIADNYLGWIGIILALVATATTFPSFMQPGNIDIVASKPIHRHVLFLARYAGAMCFILVQALVFVGLTFCVMGFRWHVWVWGYWWVVPLVLLLFSYLFSFCVLFGVWTQRSMTALMLTMIVWFFMFAVQTSHTMLAITSAPDEFRQVRRVIDIAHWVVPKTQDIPIIAGKLVGASLLTDMIRVDRSEGPENAQADFHRAAAAERHLAASVDPFTSIASSLAAEAVIIILAMWRFNRRDF